MSQPARQAAAEPLLALREITKVYGRGGFGGTRVWVLENGKPAAKWVRTGATDGQVTEISSGELKPGDEVIVDVATSGGRG